MWSSTSDVAESGAIGRSCRLEIGLVSILLVIATFIAVAADETPTSKSKTALRIDKDAKKRRIVARDAYAWLQSLGAKEISLLEHRKDMNHSLTAAWQRTRRDPSATSAARFIGFMEGKIDAELPWELHRDVYANCGAEKSAPDGEGTVDFKRSSVFDRRCYLRSGDVLALDADDKLRYERGVEVMRFDADLIRTATPSHDFIQLWTFKDAAVLATYDDSGSPFRIWCLQKADGKLIWTQVVWADQADMILTKGGAWHHTVHVTATEDRVLVLGSNGSIYCEEFDLKSGENRYRFSSSCWNGSRASFFVGNSKKP